MECALRSCTAAHLCQRKCFGCSRFQVAVDSRGDVLSSFTESFAQQRMGFVVIGSVSAYCRLGRRRIRLSLLIR